MLKCRNPHTLLTNVPPDAKFFTVTDLCSAFFTVPLAEDSQCLFAFMYRGKQYTYTKIPLGYRHSPHAFNQILKNDLEGLELNSKLLQDMDDLLFCAPTLDDCHWDSIKVLQRLAEGGHKVSESKLQYCQMQMEYLGRRISHRVKAFSPSQLEGIAKAPHPQTIRQMMTFLGMTGFTSEQVEDNVEKTALLREIMK